MGDEMFEGDTLDFSGMGIHTIGNSAFYFVPTISRIIFDGGNYTFGNQAFSYCSN
jgi:hypothetical protein